MKSCQFSLRSKNKIDGYDILLKLFIILKNENEERLIYYRLN